MRERVPLLAGLALLAIGVVIGAVVLADGIRDRNPSEGDVLTVTGSAKQRILSDYVVWNVALTSQQPTTASAAEQLGSWADRLRAFLESRGVRPEEVTVQPISTESLTRRGNVYAYRLSRTFEVRSPRVEEIADTVERSSALLTQGIPVAGQPLQYVYTKLPSLRLQLLGEATKDAQNRAQVIAEATGARLGGLRGVNVGVFQVTSPNSTEVDDYGFYDTSTLEKDVTAVVNVTFAVDS